MMDDSFNRSIFHQISHFRPGAHKVISRRKLLGPKMVCDVKWE